MLHGGMAGVVPTGIPERGYDGPEAEKIRQEMVVGQFRARDPELWEAVVRARRDARAAQAHWEVMRLKLAGAVGAGGVHDVLAVIDRDMTEAEKREAVGMENKPVIAPEYAFSAEEQAKRQAERNQKPQLRK